ncbi:hypothetical protein [Pantanalinema sp. GBBB05]|uniref:hypothetical protein n=1 Tax=Pantanalinema sp. GBBB05 TaxID=2604139 RepID=UPI003D81A1CA
MITIWKPSGKYWRLLLGQILQLRDHDLLDVICDEDIDGIFYEIRTDGDRYN